MAITIEIQKNAGGWVDYSAYISPGVIREEVEEELTAFRSGDVTCQFQNFAGTFITTGGTGLFDGWLADDTFYIRIKRDSEYHFGGIINYESLNYNAKTKLGEFTSFNYLKYLESVSTEAVRRAAATFTLAEDAAEGDDYIEVDEAVSGLYKDDILIVDTLDIIGYATEERTVKYTDAANKKIYFTEPLASAYTAGNAFAELKTRQYREKTVSFLVDELAKAAGYTPNVDFIKDIPTEIEIEYLNADLTAAGGASGFVKSIVGSATGGSPHIVTTDGRFEGDFGDMFTQLDAVTSKEIDFLNDGYLPPTSFTKRFREQSNYLYWYAYAHDRDKKWWLTEHGSGTITVKSADWNNVSQAWENEQTVGTFSGEGAISPAYDRKNGFVYVGKGASPNTDRLYYVRLSDTTIQYFSGLDFYNNFRYLYFADTLLSISKPAGKAKRFRYSGGSMTYLGEADFPKGANVDTLICVTDAAHTEFNKIMCLCKITDGELNSIYLWYCDHDMTNQTYEYIAEGELTADALTYEDGNLYMSVSDEHKAFYYSISKYRPLWVRDANFSNMNVAQAFVNLAIVARAVFKSRHNGKLYFHDRVRYIDSVATDISNYITEQHVRNWKNRIDGVRVKWWKGEEIYPSWATGEIVQIDCELIDTASYAQYVGYYYYRILHTMRKMCEVELPLMDLGLLNWVSIGSEQWVIYGLEKDLKEQKMKLTLREKFIEAVS